MKENKKTFEEPKLEVLKFDATDIIATSENYDVEPKKPKSTASFKIFG